jgi:hypothetical protein
MKTIIVGLGLITISISSFAQNTSLGDSSFALKAHSLTNSGQHLEQMYFEDFNNDSIPDAIFLDRTTGVNIHQQSINIKMVPGTSLGFDSSRVQIIHTDKWIENLFFADWNNDGFNDLILEKSYPIDENSANSGLINILFLDGIEILDTLSFLVPNQLYLGNEGPALSLTDLRDMDLDGNIDMILHGFSPVSIGWNNDGGLPEFDEITNFGFNTYSARIIDLNQDGYPDLINDDQYWKQPVVHINKKNRAFTRKAVGLPGWSFNNPATMYWSFHPHFLNDDYYPDMLVRKAGEQTNGDTYELHVFNKSKERYTKIESVLNTQNHGNMYSIHINNDGFTDFLDIRNDGITLWVNNQQNDFTSYSIPFNSEFYAINNLIYSDFDNDNDLDIFFSFVGDDTLYQIKNLESFQNSAPTKPIIENATLTDGELAVSWDHSNDHESQTGHLKFLLEITSEHNVISIISHSDSVNLQSFVEEEYSLTVTAIDPLGKSSEASNLVTIKATNAESDDYFPKSIALHQNYPNPFNPSTVISYHLTGNSMVRLRVFDALGREVAVLVDELQSAGRHQITFDAAGLASGVYYYVLNADEQILTKKLTLIK